MFSRFDRVPVCPRQTDGQTDGTAVYEDRAFQSWINVKDYTTLNKRHSILINSKPLLQCMNDKEIQSSQTGHASAGYSTEEDNCLPQFFSSDPSRQLAIPLHAWVSTIHIFPSAQLKKPSPQSMFSKNEQKHLAILMQFNSQETCMNHLNSISGYSYRQITQYLLNRSHYYNAWMIKICI